MEIFLDYNSTFSAGLALPFKGKNLQELCGFRGPNGHTKRRTLR